MTFWGRCPPLFWRWCWCWCWSTGGGTNSVGTNSRSTIGAFQACTCGMLGCYAAASEIRVSSPASSAARRCVPAGTRRRTGSCTSALFIAVLTPSAVTATATITRTKPGAVSPLVFPTECSSNHQYNLPPKPLIFSSSSSSSQPTENPNASGLVVSRPGRSPVSIFDLVNEEK